MELLPYKYLVTILKDEKITEQLYCQSKEQVRTLQAVARSLGGTATCYELNIDKGKNANAAPVKSEKPTKKEVTPQTRKKWNKPIQCVETGTIYPTVRDCSIKNRIPYKSLWNAINSGNPRNGLHFRAV